MIPESVDATIEILRGGRYVCDRSLATSVFLAMKLGRPLFLEGDAGVGKTEIAKVLAEQLGRRLIRLQCYEGLDLASAAYEWNYGRQMMEIRLAEATEESADRATLEQGIFSEKFLIERPLLSAVRQDPGGADAAGPPVLLIDELDRTDEPFEAFLLEVLSDFQLSIPEVGTIRAPSPPIVIITSNRTREIHDALKRRCFYHWVDYPSAQREREILALRCPDAKDRLTAQVVAFVQRLRQRDLFKVPGVAESIDWTHALLALDRIELAPDAVEDTMGVVLKYQDDIERIRGGEDHRILDEVREELGPP
jgi:MoxR-like ATPase